MLARMLRLTLMLLVGGSSLDTQAMESFLLVAQENYPPFQYRDENGGVRCLDVEIIQQAAALAQVQVTIRLAPWARALSMVQSGQADGVFGCGKKPEREAYLYFIDPPLRYSEMVLFANDHFTGSIQSLNDLQGQTVGVVNQYAVSPAFDSNTQIHRDLANSAASLFQKLANHRHPLAVYNKIAGWDQVKRLGGQNIRILPYVLASYPSYLAFSKQSRKGYQGWQKFSQALAQLKARGTLKRLYEQYEP